MRKEKVRIYIDMDHTFCDFNESLDYWRKRALTDVEKTWPWSMKGFFESLLPMEGAIEFWNKWKDEVDIWFLTRPSVPNRQCYTEKANWIYKYLGNEGLEKLILCTQKDLLIGDILVDDDARCGQTTFRGAWWQFGSDKCPDWKSVDDQLTEFNENRPTL